MTTRADGAKSAEESWMHRCEFVKPKIRGHGEMIRKELTLKPGQPSRKHCQKSRCLRSPDDAFEEEVEAPKELQKNGTYEESYRNQRERRHWNLMLQSQMLRANRRETPTLGECFQAHL